MFSRRLPPFEPPRTAADDHRVLLDGLTRLGTHAATLGTAIMLEPLNRYEDHMVNTLSQAAALVASTGLPSVRVAADTFHMDIEEVTFERAIADAGALLAHVQVSDSNRLEPGAGHLDWDRLLGALTASGYDGWLAFECRLSGAPSEVLPPSVALLRGLLERVAG
jgi:sugar phosphate isomerase/epimerase